MAQPVSTPQQTTNTASTSSGHNYKCYADYVEDLMRNGSPYDDYKPLLAQLRDQTYRIHQPPSFVELIRFFRSRPPSMVTYAIEGERIKQEQLPVARVSLSVLKDVLATLEDDLEYQVVLIGGGLPPAEVVDVVGFGLDLDPTVWALLETQSNRFGQHGKDVHFHPPEAFWTVRNDLLKVGRNALMVLEAVPQRRPRTAVIHFYGLFGRLLGSPAPSTYAAMFRAPSPLSTATQPPGETIIYQLSPGLSAIHRWLFSATSNINRYGSNNFLFACVEALVYWHISHAPSTPEFGDLDDKITPKFYATWKLSYYFSSPDDLPQYIWNRLRNEADERQAILDTLPLFVHENFNSDDASFKRAYKTLEMKVERCTKEVTLAEGKLRDQISIVSTIKSTEMAEISIEESKRVMLLSLFAFIFIPISLASSIFGMNVQQINATGHSIRAFVFTALAVLGASVFFWIGMSGLRTYRAFRRKELESQTSRRDLTLKYDSNWNWFDHILFMNEKLGRNIQHWRAARRRRKDLATRAYMGQDSSDGEP